MDTDKHRFRKISGAILTLLLICAIWFCTMPATAVQSGAKSTGLSQIGEIRDMEQVRAILLEHARAIDFIHRQLLDDVDTINRDEIPNLQDQIDSLDLDIDFDLPLMEGITWSVDAGVPKWTAGTIQYGETTYTIDAWASGDTTASTRGIYWTLTNEGTGKVQTKFYGKDSPDAYPNRWYMAFFDGSSLYPAVQSTIIHGGLIQANTLTANQIAANAITVSDMDSATAGRLFTDTTTKSTVEGWKYSTTTYIDGGDIYTGTITAGQIGTNALTVGDMDSTATGRLFSDSTTKTNVEAWRHASDATLIDGGDIYANSVTVAKFNADATGRMFTDSTTKTNIEAWKSGSDVTKIDGGDIYAGSSITLGSSGHIKSGQTAYDTGTGWWLGDVSGTPKFSIGNSSGKKLTWDGTDLRVTGQILSGSHGGTTEGTGGLFSFNVVASTVNSAIGLIRQTLHGSMGYGYLGVIGPATSHFSSGFVVSPADTNSEIFACIGYQDGAGGVLGVNAVRCAFGGQKYQNKLSPDSGYTDGYDNPVLYTVADGTDYWSIRLGSDGTQRGTIDGSDGKLSNDATCITSGTIADARIPTTLSSKTLSDCSCSTNFSIPTLSSAPTGRDGAMYYNTTDHKFYVYGNGGWESFVSR